MGANMLGIQRIVVGSSVASLIDHAIWTSARWGGDRTGRDEFHRCCARLRQSLISAVAPATK